MAIDSIGLGGSLPRFGSTNFYNMNSPGIGGAPQGFSHLYGGMTNNKPSFGSEAANGISSSPFQNGGYQANKIAGFGQGAPTLGAAGANYYGEVHGNGGARPGVKPQFNAVQQARMNAGMPANNQPMPGQASPRQAVLAAYPHG